MPFYFMIVFMIVFVLSVAYFAKVVILQSEQAADEDILRIKESYAEMIRQKDELSLEKSRLQEEADSIFGLYDLMRDITKTFDEEEAFQAFKEHIYRHIMINDCQLVETLPKDMDDFSSFKGYQFFPLKAKRMVLGELVYKGVEAKDEEVFGILAQQFALALRRIKLYKEVENMAVTDGLTRLHTRRHLMERFEEEFARAKLRKSAFSFLMADIDHFKRINDQHGHLVGDQVLREVGRIVNLSTREIDIAGRFGGEEFCVILPDTDKEGALLVAERIRCSVCDQKIKAYDAALAISISIGVAAFPDDAHKMEELLENADLALYRAKKLGRNCVVGFSGNADEKQEKL
ncbi:MAG: GGDEF domain-containing protein [Candidatus Omnitrophica bacterium]|nr:GGDEF domain-containing protein [Candidatus Omnitrophota bacterium]